jgi:acyl carrier protein
MIVRNVREVTPESTDANVDRDTKLLGGGGVVDSLGLVSLIVSLEQAIDDEWHVNLSLADERAMSQTRSPYRTVGSLAEYVTGLIVEEKRRDD